LKYQVKEKALSLPDEPKALLAALATMSRPARWHSGLDSASVKEIRELSHEPLERITIYGIVDPSRVLGIAPALNEPGLAQDAHMVRNKAQRHA